MFINTSKKKKKELQEREIKKKSLFFLFQNTEENFNIRVVWFYCAYFYTWYLFVYMYFIVLFFFWSKIHAPLSRTEMFFFTVLGIIDQNKGKRYVIKQTDRLQRNRKKKKSGRGSAPFFLFRECHGKP